MKPNRTGRKRTDQRARGGLKGAGDCGGARARQGYRVHPRAPGSFYPGPHREDGGATEGCSVQRADHWLQRAQGEIGEEENCIGDEENCVGDVAGAGLVILVVDGVLADEGGTRY